MKTVIIPIFDGTVAKNILRTKVFEILRGAPEVRIIIIPPEKKKEVYQKEFASEHVHVESDTLWKDGAWGTFFAGLFLHSIPTNFMRIRQIDWFWNEGKYVHYIGASVLRFLGGFVLWRRFLMTLASMEPIDQGTRSLYEQWKPDMVFAPTMIPSLEVALMRLARKDGKTIVGMSKSWDNLTSKAFLRIFPDTLLVPNEIGVEEAVRVYGFPRERVVATGIPQYDDYIHPDFLENKEDFLKGLDLNEKKRTILYAPAGDWMNPHDKEILKQILDWMAEGKITNTQVLLRLHPAYTSKTEELKGTPGLVIERPGTHFGGLKSYEFFDKDVRHLASSIAYTDLTINTASTMSIEAAIYDKPVILLAYDGEKSAPYTRSIRRYYDREHYVPIVRSGGAWIVKSTDELLAAITTYFAHPETHREGRARIVKEECVTMDGKACERIAGAVLAALRN